MHFRVPGGHLSPHAQPGAYGLPCAATMRHAAVSGAGETAITEQWRAVAFLAYVGSMYWAYHRRCTPAFYRHNADRVAYDIIQQKQSAVLGRTEPFTIESPADTLRRRTVARSAVAHPIRLIAGYTRHRADQTMARQHYLEPPAGGDPLVDSFRRRRLFT